MAIYGAFSTSVLGMMSQSAALHNIGTNVANVNTGGFKRTDTSFSTVLSDSMQNISDIGGVRPRNTSTITQQGAMVASNSATDLAIAGKGFFVLNSQQDGNGQQLFTRDGSLEVTTVNDINVTGIGGVSVATKDGYLSDKNGYFVQGWPYTNGTVTTSGTPQSLRVDQYAFLGQFEPTTTANFSMNLPANDAIGAVRRYDITVTDSVGDVQTEQLSFTKTATNAWAVSSPASQASITQVDTLTLAGTTGALEVGDVYSVTVNGSTKTYTTDGTEADIDTVRDNLLGQVNADPALAAVLTATASGAGAITLTSNTQGTAFTISSLTTNSGTTSDSTITRATNSSTALTFDSNGQITTPTSLDLALTFTGGSTSAVTMDIASMTQYSSSGDDLNVKYSKNGFASSNMRSFNFDGSGNVTGSFEDGTSRTIYKLALGVFSNPSGLDAKNGNVYAISPESGDVTITTADSNGYASFAPNTRELSNVDIAEEFTKMMTTQTAYNASSTVFQTTDEMTTVARDLKR